MGNIRRELGPEAIILSSRNVRNKGLAGLFRKPMVEVVVAYDVPEPQLRQKFQSVREEQKPAVDDEKLQQLAKEIAALQDMVADFTQKIITVEKESTLKFTHQTAKLYARLVDNDVEEEIAKPLVLEAQSIAAKVEDSPESVLHQLLLDKLGEAAPIKLKKFKRNIFMLVGPTGVGKTTTLVKLAGMFIGEQGLKVGLINTDTYRIGAHDQIRTYADIMAIPLHIVYTPEEMSAALKAQEDRDVILIDTVGKNSWDEEYKENLKSILQVAAPDEIMLAVSVNTSRQAVKEIIDNYSFLESFKTIVTKLDEVKVWGNVVNIVTRTKHPLAYVTAGQSVPDDIEPADIKKIIANILAKGEG